MMRREGEGEGPRYVVVPTLCHLHCLVGGFCVLLVNKVGYSTIRGGYDVMHGVISDHDYRESAYFCICL